MKSFKDIQELLLSEKNGRVSPDTLAFFLFLKAERRKSKEKQFYAFAINHEEIEDLSEAIETLILMSKSDVSFQVAVSSTDLVLIHWSFLEFNFKLNHSKKPTLKIFICDPLGIEQTICLAARLSHVMQFGNLSRFCELKVYLSNDTLQIRGRDCAYFTLDNMAMLSNQSEFESLYDYMENHQLLRDHIKVSKKLYEFRKSLTMLDNEEENEELNKVFHFDFVVSSLPVRLLRTKQSVPDLKKEIEETGLAFDIVNHKKETAWRSISRYLFLATTRTKEQTLRNMRVNKKKEIMEVSIQKAIEEIRQKPSLETERIDFFNQAVSQHRSTGLKKFINTLSTECLEEKDNRENLSYI